MAFSLTMVTISMLIFTIGTPKPYYDSLEQAHQLAHDTLQVLATSTDSPSSGTYLEQIIGGGDANGIMFRVAGGDTDSIGAIAGAVSGAFNGMGKIPARWRENVEGGEYIESVAYRIYTLTPANRPAKRPAW